MAYRIETDEPVGVAIRRIGREQTQKALDDLANADKPTAWRIHRLRKRCKGIRALVRLVRPGFAEYKAANSRFRDIARELSGERDARIMADRRLMTSSPV